jgi:hypothetical protein
LISSAIGFTPRRGFFSFDIPLKQRQCHNRGAKTGPETSNGYYSIFLLRSQLKRRKHMGRRVEGLWGYPATGMDSIRLCGPFFTCLQRLKVMLFFTTPVSTIATPFRTIRQQNLNKWIPFKSICTGA